ncbi:MAG: hypothetical protein EPN47_18495 [Acidobacteria bacterium]|nr:MAG: hypothetical protein EPN47_18495 [Acidobacteriota bacterium]
METTLTALQKLAGNKAPVVGIPHQGEKPFAVERARLAGLIDGLENCGISLNSHLEIQTPARHYTLYSLDMERHTAAYKMLRSWAARQRRKREAPKLSRDERRKSELLQKIAIAERKGRRLRVCRPYNPLLEFGDAASDYERKHWAAWVAQKPMRRNVGKLAATHGLIHGYIPDAVIRQPRKLYESLADLTGLYVTKYGELRTTSRREKPTEAQYLKHLYEYVGGGSLAACPQYGAAFQSKPYRSQEWRTPEHIRQERLSYCQRMRDWRNAQETVNWLRAQLASFDPATQEDGHDLR